MTMYHYSIQLQSHVDGGPLLGAGGVCYVATAGGAAKVALKDKDGGAADNPVALVRGKIEFYTANTVNSVDLYGIDGEGHFFVAKGIRPSGPGWINIDPNQRHQCMVIPFSIADTTDNVETETGFTLETNMALLPGGVLVDVLTADSSETIDVGTDGSGGNDPDGIIDGLSLTNAVAVKATLLNSGVTLGALLKVQDSANAGDAVPEAYIDSAAEDITYTLSSGTDTAEGFIYLPYLLVG